jgi:hypothetical protein
MTHLIGGDFKGNIARVELCDKYLNAPTPSVFKSGIGLG